jgi:hypothetical protein
MTPQANTLYSICLYLTLCGLLKWTARPHRAPANLRRRVAALLPVRKPGS